MIVYEISLNSFLKYYMEWLIWINWMLRIYLDNEFSLGLDMKISIFNQNWIRYSIINNFINFDNECINIIYILI